MLYIYWLIFSCNLWSFFFFSKVEKYSETLIQAVTIYSDDIGIESGIEKCAMLIIKSGNQQMTVE